MPPMILEEIERIQERYKIVEQDPSIVATPYAKGSLLIFNPTLGTPKVYLKLDGVLSTNVQELGAGGGGDYHDPCRVASADGETVNVAVAPASVDGVVLSSGDRVLRRWPLTDADNGIWIFNGAGVPMTRAPDADQDAEVTYGFQTWVIEGATNALTGWILVTPNPITVGVTPLTFNEIPLPASITTSIDGLYWVASNGNDANLGSLAAPFLTIQAAINKAVADGHTNSNNANIIVLPKAGTYAGFTAVPGVNVMGLQGASARVRVGKVIFAPTTPVAINNEVQFTNLNFRVSNDNAFHFPAGANTGKVFFSGCRFNNTAGAQYAALMENVGGTISLSGCTVVSSGGGIHMVAGFLSGNGSAIGAPVDGDITGIALLTDSGTDFEISGGNIVTSGAGHSAADISGTGLLRSVSIRDLSSGSDGLTIRTGASVKAFNCDITVDAIQKNYVVEGGAGLDKSNLVFLGSSDAVTALGVINLLPNSEEWFVETHTVTVGEAAAKQFDLSRFPLRTAGVPASANLKLSFMGVDQDQPAAYDIVGGGYTVDWNGKTLDGFVAAGDKFIIGYWASRL